MVDQGPDIRPRGRPAERSSPMVGVAGKIVSRFRRGAAGNRTSVPIPGGSQQSSVICNERMRHVIDDVELVFDDDVELVFDSRSVHRVRDHPRLAP